MRTRLLIAAALAAAALPVAACGYSDPYAGQASGPVAGTATLAPPAASPSAGASPSSGSPDTFNEGAGLPVRTLPDGLQLVDIKVGDGPGPASLDDKVTVNYTGWLKSNGTQFDSSYKEGTATPATFALNGVIPGFGEGLLSMKVGGKRKLIIPSKLGYGAAGGGSVIPPNADLVFIVDLVSVAPAGPSPTPTP